MEKTELFMNHTGLLCQKSHWNYENIVVPKDLRTKILCIIESLNGDGTLPWLTNLFYSSPVDLLEVYEHRCV